MGIAVVLSKVDAEARVHTWGMAAGCRLGGRITWTEADMAPEVHCSRISFRMAVAAASMLICEIWTLIGMVFVAGCAEKLTELESRAEFAGVGGVCSASGLKANS